MQQLAQSSKANTQRQNKHGEAEQAKRATEKRKQSEESGTTFYIMRNAPSQSKRSNEHHETVNTDLERQAAVALLWNC